MDVNNKSLKFASIISFLYETKRLFKCLSSRKVKGSSFLRFISKYVLWNSISVLSTFPMHFKTFWKCTLSQMGFGFIRISPAFRSFLFIIFKHKLSEPITLNLLPSKSDFILPFDFVIFVCIIISDQYFILYS